MLIELIQYFLQLSLWSAFASGIGNGLLYYGKGLARNPESGQEHRRLIVSSIIFGITSALITLGFIAGVAIFTYPLFQHTLALK